MPGQSLLDEIISAGEFVLKGHTACPGCGSALALRYVLKALGKETILVIPASCSSVYQGIYPKTSFNVHTFNTAFASAAAVASGIKQALEAKGSEPTSVVVWGGDGGLTDIGFATVSGAAERNEDILVIEYDNEAYMNTGIQRSGSTPKGAITTTTHLGKKENKKSISLLTLMHGVPYVATANSAYPLDLYQKVKKAKNIKGFRLIHIFSPCPPGWRYDDSKTVEVGKLAVETGYWILWEAENVDGKIKLKLSGPSRPYINPEKRKPIEEFLKLQGRFRRMSPEAVEGLKKWIDSQWELIKRFMD
ncbi:MAG: 3-methyl-2-oxobutanoate dehydrogenase subunit beta [Candidatus Njordarchaeia archaeon]